MKKLFTLAAALITVTLSVSGQRTIYHWNFNSGNGSAFVDSGNGTLGIIPVSGTNPPVTVMFSSTGGPWGTNGCYLVPDGGQGYSSGDTVVATSTNLTGIGSLNQVTVTFWFKYGPTVIAQFPRFVQFGAAPNYDAGGKGDAHNGIGASINGWYADGSGMANQMQDGLGNASANQNPQFTVTNAGAFTELQSNTWYFCALSYDGTLAVNNFRAYLGSTALSVTNVGMASANYGAINFGNNSTVMMGNDEISGTPRALTGGAIADVRLLSGVAAPAALEAVRLLLTNFPVAGGPPTFVTQPYAGSSYVGGLRTLSVGVGGTFPFAYQWKHAGTNLPSATNASLVLSNVQLSAAGNYVCTVTNVFGTNNSATAIVSVLTAPANSFAAAVLAQQPYGYWHLNEVNTNADPNAPVHVFDYVGGHDGVAANPTNTLIGVSGPPYTGFPIFNTGMGVISNGAPSAISMPPLPGYTNIMTILGWAYLRGNVAPGGLIMVRDPLSGNGYGNCWGLEICKDTNNPVADFNQLGFEWGAEVPGFLNTDFLTNGALGETGLHVPTNQWVFVALYGGNAGTYTTIYMGDSLTNLQTFESYVTLNDYGPNSGSLCLGYDPLGNGGGFPSTTYANISFSDVAVFYNDLRDATIRNLYRTGLGSGTVLSLKAERSGSNLVVSWTTGRLLQATSPTGPWTDTGATSPYTIPMSSPAQFFRAVNP